LKSSIHSLNYVKKKLIFLKTYRLTDEEVQVSRKSFQNEQIHKQTHKWWLAFFDLFKEPMLLLLIIVAFIYFVMGQNNEAILCWLHSRVSGILSGQPQSDCDGIFRKE
jgi:magnesium-transporting ATPase (P-type)